MRSFKNILLPVLLLFLASSCKKDTARRPVVNFVFKFDSTQARLNNLGQSSTMPSGNAAQSPVFNSMSAHYVELTPNQFTAIGGGDILYRAPETTAGGANAIDFSKSTFAGNNQVFLSVPIDSVAPGSYNWLRVSLAYQNYQIKYHANGQQHMGTIASFIGFNTYVNSYQIKDSIVHVNANKLQGYWGFETSVSGFGVVRTGQSQPGATTVPNPIFATSPIPAGSCLVTGQFTTPLVITGNETSDITIVVSLSTNKSFEWLDADSNGMYDPLAGDQVVDMGIRGMIPFRQ